MANREESTSPHDLIAACAFGLEAIVKRELEALGIDARIGDSGRVHFRGDDDVLARANLWLRTADRVLIRVANFPAADFDALFESTRQIGWDRWLPRDAAFPVTGRSVRSQLSSVPAVQRSVKRAIVDSMRREHGVENLPEDGATYAVDVGLLRDVATLTIDTTGRSLHRRGYRTDISRAPLKETLAAAMVLLSFWKPGRPMLDPFCGSGTIPIEAARIGRNIAPGLNRDFSFATWPQFQTTILDELRQHARQEQHDGLDERIIGSDFDGRILKAARDNASRAGVADDIHFQAGRMEEVTSQRRFGCLITNPPYGRRIGTGDREATNEHDWELESLYHAFPDVLRKLPTWSHYILTAFPGFEEIVGRQADRRRKLYNGRIECTYFQFHGPKPIEETRPPSSGNQPSTVLVHAEGSAAFGELDDKANHQAELFHARLTKRARHLRRWPAKRGITCFRLYERDIPEIPLIVDRYDDHLHLTEYERPHDRDIAQHANWLELMATTAAGALSIPADHVHLKSRRRQRGLTQHEKQDDRGKRLTVHEGGLKFLVNLDDYVDTGLFLDHRVTRQMVREESAGKDFLNLFAYTGSFSVYAADGGASSTVSVDLSRTYLDWAWENMRLNGFSGNNHTYVAGDVSEFVRSQTEPDRFDLAVVDPPTFSNSKRTDQDWNIQRDAVPLLRDVLRAIRPGGVVYFSSNFRRFKLDEAALPVSEIHEISRQTVPEDFRNRRIHRCWRMVK